MNIDLKPLREEFSSLHEQAERIIAKATEEKRELTADEKAETEKCFARLDSIKEIEAKNKKLAEYAFAENKVEKAVEPEGKAERDAVEIKVGDTYENGRKLDRKDFAKAANSWFVTGQMDRRFATITTATASGAMLPKEVLPPIVPSNVNVFREAIGVYGVDPLNTPGTNDISLPVLSASAGGVVSETASSETENAPSLTESISLPVSTYQSGSVWFSAKQLSAVDFDLFAETLPSLVYSKELAVESAAVTAISGDSNITQSVATSTVSGFTYGNLVSLNRKLAKKYDVMKVIVLSKDAYTAAENLTTSTGYPILNQDAQNQNLKRFNGTPVLRSDYLGTFGANNVVGFIMSLVGFRLRDAGQTWIQRYTQNQARPGQQGMNLYSFHSIGYAPSAMAKLVCPAS